MRRHTPYTYGVDKFNYLLISVIVLPVLLKYQINTIIWMRKGLARAVVVAMYVKFDWSAVILNFCCILLFADYNKIVIPLHWFAFVLFFS